MLGLTKAWYGNYNNQVTELGGGSSVGELIYAHTYNGSITSGVLSVSDVISSLNGHKFIYLHLIVRSWSSSNSSSYWYSDLFSGTGRYTDSNADRSAPGIVVSETDIATINGSGAGQGYVSYSIAARNEDGHVISGYFAGYTTIDFTLNVYSA